MVNRLPEVLGVLAPFNADPADDASLGALARRAHRSRFALHRPAVFAYVQESGLAFAGPPLARYPVTGTASLVIEGGMPVVELPASPPEGEIEALTVPAGRAVVALHRGPYEGLPDTHIAIESYLVEHGLVALGPPWESYVTDPGERPDPASWETEVVQPIS